MLQLLSQLIEAPADLPAPVAVVGAGVALGPCAQALAEQGVPTDWAQWLAPAAIFLVSWVWKWGHARVMNPAPVVVSSEETPRGKGSPVQEEETGE